MSPPRGRVASYHPFHSDLAPCFSMSVEKAKSTRSSDDSQIIANVVLAGDVSLDEEHKNAGGAPVEDKSPIGQDVGWWTAVFLSTSMSTSTSSVQFAKAETTGANRHLTHDWHGFVLLWPVRLCSNVYLGIFSTPGTILRQGGSIGLALICELIA